MTKKIDCHRLQDELKKKALVRLNRIEGQVRGIKKMIEEDRSCLEILDQMQSTQKAIAGSKKIIFRNYLETCATLALGKDTSEGTYDDLMETIYKYS
jgi:DNA-binding FrmR family transcriptional regulator